METLRSRILVCFVERAPNPLTSSTLLNLLSGVDPSELERELSALSEAGALRSRMGPKRAEYVLPSYEHIPVREYVAIGNVKVPRMLAGDTARSEDVNIFFEVLARRLVEIEAEAQAKFDEKLKSYWGNIVTLFGAFIGVFSLIVGFLKTIPMEPNASFWSVLAVSSAQVIPLAVVLGAFVWFLRAQFRDA
jgi:hypothetical protein